MKGQWSRYLHLGNDVPKEVLIGTPQELLEGISQVSSEAPVGLSHEAMAAIASAERLGKAVWIMDTGSGLDLVSEEAVQDLPPEQWHRLVRLILLDTAGGESEADTSVIFKLDQLDEDVNALVLPSIPYVLSLGRRCQNEGYGFWWPPYGLPHLMLPSGRVMVLRVYDYIPYLTPGLKPECGTYVPPWLATDVFETTKGSRVTATEQVEKSSHIGKDSRK